MTPDKLAEMRDDEFCASLRATARTMELMGRVSEAREVREAVGRIEAAAQRAERAEAALRWIASLNNGAIHGHVSDGWKAQQAIRLAQETLASLSPAPAAKGGA